MADWTGLTWVVTQILGVVRVLTITHYFPLHSRVITSYGIRCAAHPPRWVAQRLRLWHTRRAVPSASFPHSCVRSPIFLLPPRSDSDGVCLSSGCLGLGLGCLAFDFENRGCKFMLAVRQELGDSGESHGTVCHRTNRSRAQAKHRIEVVVHVLCT